MRTKGVFPAGSDSVFHLCLVSLPLPHTTVPPRWLHPRATESQVHLPLHMPRDHGAWQVQNPTFKPCGEVLHPASPGIGTMIY